MSSTSEPSEHELAELAALADGSLPPARREEVEAKLAESPTLRALVEEQRRAVRQVRAAAGRAPRTLRERLEDQRRRAGPRPLRLHPRAVAAIVAVLAAMALAGTVLLLPGGAPGGPTVVEAAGLTSRGPTEAAPAHAEGSRVVSAAVDGVGFPYWGNAFGWEAAGRRSDRLDGRLAITIFYVKNGVRLGYTIVSGRALTVPSDARADQRRGTTFHSFRDRGRLVVTWRRAGRTCVLAGDRVSRETLLRLAAWR